VRKGWRVSERTLGEQYDDMMDRLDQAYAARRDCDWGTTEWAEANAALEVVFVDLRALNDLVWQSTGGRPRQHAPKRGLGR
jgi:hypothetical protein